MSQVTRTANHCDVCSHEWLPTLGVVYTHCTSGKCRSRLWNGSEREKAMSALKAIAEGKIYLSEDHRKTLEFSLSQSAPVYVPPRFRK